MTILHYMHEGGGWYKIVILIIQYPYQHIYNYQSNKFIESALQQRCITIFRESSWEFQYLQPERGREQSDDVGTINVKNIQSSRLVQYLFTNIEHTSATRRNSINLYNLHFLSSSRGNVYNNMYRYFTSLQSNFEYHRIQ